MIEHVVVVVPARDEELLVGGCLDALAVAADRVAATVDVLLVCDDCTDRTAEVGTAAGVTSVAGCWRNVGRARAAGFAHALADAVRTDAPWLERRSAWFATTDADTRVEPDWLAAQLALADDGADAVLGVVVVDDWSDHPAALRAAYEAHYAADDLPVHGASLGVRMTAYLAVGGLLPLPVGEDRDLALRLAARPGLTVVPSGRVRAVTSARASSRVTGGFATLLTELAR